MSGIFFGGPPGDLLSAWRDGAIEIVVSREIVAEYVRVGERLSAQFPVVDLNPALQLLAATAMLVVAPPLPEPACGDADDDRFLACAVAAEVRYVVSGDLDLPYQAVTVLRPRDFLELLSGN